MKGIKIKNWIILGLVSILIGFNIILSIKLSKQMQLNIELQNTTIIDSIKIENNVLKLEIETLQKDLEIKKHTVDSLQNVKQKIIVETKYVISNNITEGVMILKENLKWEKLQ